MASSSTTESAEPNELPPTPAASTDGRSRGRALLFGLSHFLPVFFWSLWFGGLLTLFIFVQALFTLRRDIAGDAASALFMVFGRYQLILGGLTLIFAVFGYGIRPSWRLLSAFVAFALALAPAIYLAMLIIPHMEALREKYLAHSAQFSQLHGISMALFVIEAVLILIGGLLLIVPDLNRAD